LGPMCSPLSSCRPWPLGWSGANRPGPPRGGSGWSLRTPVVVRLVGGVGRGRAFLGDLQRPGRGLRIGIRTHPVQAARLLAAPDRTVGHAEVPLIVTRIGAHDPSLPAEREERVRTSRDVSRILCPHLSVRAATIHLGTPSPGASSGPPAGSGEQPSNTCAT